MNICCEKHDRTLVLALEGELEADGGALLEERCLYELQEGTLHYVIDLGRLERVAGSGLRVLLRLARTLPRSGGSIVLCSLERGVQEALEVSGLAGSFELAADRDAALRRARELQLTPGPRSTDERADAAEKIELAIELLRSADSPRARRRPPQGG
jgi:anti-anti-sigma factor